MKDLIHAILEGDCGESASQAESLLRLGVSADRIVIDGVEAAMSALDAKCTLQQFNLLEIMLAGRAVMDVMKLLYPLGTSGAVRKGTVVIASLEGDVHDLGKNIVKMVLIAEGYHVVDCGKDCSLGRLVDAAAREMPLAIGISGLITTIVPQVKQVKGLLAERHLQAIKVIAGGAALKQSTPARLNVDFVAESAFDVLHYLNSAAGAIHE